MAVCASCRHENAPEARFCSACGAALHVRCPVCGEEAAAAAAFCSACGAALAQGAVRAQPAQSGEERRLVTVLFCDLAGSTALGDRLDPEDVREVQGEVYELIGGIVDRYGGTTEKFAGDAVMAVFGIPRAHEDDAERAVRAALDVRRAFDGLAARVRERHGLDVAIRAGVNTGEVVAGRDAAARGELMVSGDAVNVTARLQQHAPAGGVLVGERTRHASERAIVYEEHPPVSAKGKSEPLPVWLATGVRAAPRRRGVEGLEAPLIGRDHEMALLEAIAARVKAERIPQLVTLFGQAGVGKSRLVREFAQRVRPTRELRGRCLPYGDGIGYWPLTEIAKTAAGVRETDPVETARAKLRASLEGQALPADVLPWIESTIGLRADAPLSGAADEARRALQSAWARYFAAAGRDGLAMVVIEDIHWASSAMLDLIERIADAPDAGPLLLVCPARPELLEARPDWGAGGQNAAAVQLQPLPAELSSELVAALLHVDRLDNETRDRIASSAEGNPFFTEEIVRMLIDRGAIERANGGWRTTERIADIPIPDSVHGVLAARIDLLEADPRAALRRCAVVGRVFWPQAVDASADAVAALERRGLVGERPNSVMAGMREYAFKHALTRDVAYAALPRSERRRLHERVAEWIQEVAPDRAQEAAELIAHHYVQAIRYGGDGPAVLAGAHRFSLAAGIAALGRGAVAEARQHLERAREYAAGGGAAAAAGLALARADIADGDYEQALSRLAHARDGFAAAGDRLAAGDALGWTSRAAWLAGHWDEAFAAAEAAVAEMASLPESPELARALARRSQMEMLRQMPTAHDHALEAVKVARRTGERFAEANALVNAYTARSVDGLWTTAEDMHRVAALAIEAGAYEEAFRALVNFTWTAQGLTIPAVEAAVSKALAALRDYAAPEGYGDYLSLSMVKFIHVPAGRWDEAERILATVAPGQLGGNRVVELELHGALAVRRGDLAAGRSMIDQALEMARASHEPQRLMPALVLRIQQAAAERDPDAAATAARELVEGLLPIWLVETSGIEILHALRLAGATTALDETCAAMRAQAPAAPGLRRPILQAALDGLHHLAHGAPKEAAAALERARDGEVARGAAFLAALLECDLADAHAAAGNAAARDSARAAANALLDRLRCVHPV